MTFQTVDDDRTWKIETFYKQHKWSKRNILLIIGQSIVAVFLLGSIVASLSFTISPYDIVDRQHARDISIQNTTVETIFNGYPPPTPVIKSLFPRAVTNATIPLPPTASGTGLPSPFDTSLGNNYTSTTCLPFLQSFLSDPSFQACVPFSLLLQTSSRFFFAIQNDPVLLHKTLDASCAVNQTGCSALMSTLNSKLTSQAYCGADLILGNPLVGQAKAGLAAYDVLYQASCLKTPSSPLSPPSSTPSPSLTNTPTSHLSSQLVKSSNTTSHNPTPSSSITSLLQLHRRTRRVLKRTEVQGEYCFLLSSRSSGSTPGNSYIYYLPLGMSLPTTVQLDCTTPCLKLTLETFLNATRSSSSSSSSNDLNTMTASGKDNGQSLFKKGLNGAVKVVANQCGGEQWDVMMKNVKNSSISSKQKNGRGWMVWIMVFMIGLVEVI